jgi:hypothetical protein
MAFHPFPYQWKRLRAHGSTYMRGEVTKTVYGKQNYCDADFHLLDFEEGDRRGRRYQKLGWFSYLIVTLPAAAVCRPKRTVLMSL